MGFIVVCVFVFFGGLWGRKVAKRAPRTEWLGGPPLETLQMKYSASMGYTFDDPSVHSLLSFFVTANIPIHSMPPKNQNQCWVDLICLVT